jgi:hypothetical protein
MMVVRKQEIAAWMWTGEGLDAPALAAYRASLDEPSIFLELKAGTDIFAGVPAPVRAHRELLAAFEPPPAGGRITVIPLRVRNRLVAALLLEPPADGFADGSLAEFRRIAAKAAIAFELCIMRAKLRKA